MLQLRNAHYALSVDPDHGARVTSLMALGREWLVQGEPATGNIFGGAQATGWDECFPTVLACDGRDFGWPGQLRDHGALWGRPWHAATGGNWLEAIFDDPQFSFSRRMLLDDRRLVLSYAVTNRSTARIGYLYSQHLLLALQAGETLSFDGIREMSGSQVAPFRWPDARFTPVKPIEANETTKLYARRNGRPKASVFTPQGTFSLSWEDLDLGLWLDYGGWPDDKPVHQVAIEPTSAPFDALTHESVSWLMPAQTVQWKITLTVEANPK